MNYVAYVLIIIGTVVAVRGYDWIKGLMNHQQLQQEERPRRTRDMASQTPTTYTAVRGATQARFRVLPEHSHG